MMIEIVKTCPFCGKSTLIKVKKEEFRAWEMGELIQYAMPTMSATERETLITGMCAKCQDSIFECWDDDDDSCDEDDFDTNSMNEEMGFNPYSGCYDFDC